MWCVTLLSVLSVTKETRGRNVHGPYTSNSPNRTTRHTITMYEFRTYMYVCLRFLCVGSTCRGLLGEWSGEYPARTRWEKHRKAVNGRAEKAIFLQSCTAAEFFVTRKGSRLNWPKSAPRTGLNNCKMCIVLCTAIYGAEPWRSTGDVTHGDVTMFYIIFSLEHFRILSSGY